MKNKFKHIYDSDLTLESIGSEEEPPKGFQVGQRVRIMLQKKMTIGGSKVSVTVTDFGEIVELSGDVAKLSYMNKIISRTLKQLNEVNQQLRREYSVWTTYVR